MTGRAVGEVPRVTGGITGYWEMPWPGRQGKEGTGDILLNIGRFDGLAPTPPTAPEALWGGIGGGGVVPRGGVGGGAWLPPLGGGGGGGPMSPPGGTLASVWGGLYCLWTGGWSLGRGGKAGAP